MSVKVKDGKSRFSVFKFGRNAAPRPPPPPPKDAVYLAAIGNRSLASLSPESLPASPLSGDQYAASSSSAVSLSLPQQPKQRSGLFKFGTVSRKTVEVPPSPAEDDENISMPWNFQHNVHVDEGFTGLPPSWTTSLQEAGFSDDEIAAIQQRRLADRPRAQSPAAVVRPMPRSTSLPKNQQGRHTPASSVSASSASSSPIPDLPGSQYSSPKIEYASPKVDYTSPKTDYTSLKADNAKADNLRAPPSPKSPPPVYWRDEQPQPLSVPRRQPQPQQVDSRSAHSQRSLSPSPPPSRSLSPSRPLQQQQPPRAFSPALSQSQSNHSQHSHHSQPQSQAHSRSQSQQSQHSSFSDDELDELDEPAQSRSPSPARKAPSNLKNLTLDLDLSLGDPASTWSEGVLSATPWSASLKPNFEDKPAASPSSPLFTLTAPGRTEAALSDGDEFSPTAAYYAGSVTAGAAGKKERVVSTGSGEGSPRLAYDFDDYAYDERDYASDRGQSRPPSTDDKDRLDVTRDRDNRDSGMSDVTMLAPPPSAGIVSRIAVARRAVAEVVGMPAAPRVAPPPVPDIRNANANANANANVNGNGNSITTARAMPPASPQSSHFGSSGSSESQDHQTPTTEVEGDDDDTGELDYYLEGKSYLENNGFKLQGTHRERGHGGEHAGHSRSNSRKNTEELEDEEEKRRMEWEALQRGEKPAVRRVEQAQTRTEQRTRTETKPTPPLVKAATPPLQLQGRKPSPIQTQTPARTPPTQAPVLTPPTQPDPRARLMVSATETFGLGDHEEDDVEDGDGEYEYGYEFAEDDREERGIAGAVESPNAGVGGYGSAFGSPSAAPAGYGYGGSSGRASAEPRRQEEEEEEEEEDEEGTLGPKQRAALGLAIRDAAPERPQVITARRTSRAVLSPGPLTALGLATTPITPAQRYAGWVAAAVAPLEEFIDEPVDPRDFYDDLQEIAEGESGSVYAAALVPDAPMHKLKLPPLIKARDADALAKGHRVLVAIKFVELNPGGSQKLVDVQRECSLLQGLRCDHVLGLDALYVDLVEDSLWIRMELMERSLADVVGLVDEGLRLQEPRIVARFAKDMLQALDFLQKHHIAHRDLRSDNLLLNAEGFLKLADFSNAVGVTPESPLATDVVGVVYWQAPEVRSGSYDPLKIDVWSVGATVWELAEASPPFSDTQQPADRWPPLSDPALYPPSFNDFLHMCSEPAASRPTPGALLETPFVQKACGRPVIVQLLSRCTVIEQALHAGDVPPDSPP